jgi:large subunit ribosomal protein L25
VETTGEADGVKNYGGILEVILRSLPIRCLPQDLPEVIRVDVSALKVGESIHVRDLVLPKGVEAAIDADVTVIAIAEPNVAKETGAEVATSPEVIKEKKAEESSSKS